MTEKEVLEKQEANGNQAFYLIQIGSFVHAYGHGAFALSRATGYRVRVKHRKMGDLLMSGFPVMRMEQVKAKIEEAGGQIVAMPDGKTWTFRGIDGTPEEAMVTEKRAVAPKTSNEALVSKAKIIIDNLMDFDLMHSTPMDAMNFVNYLQRIAMK